MTTTTKKKRKKVSSSVSKAQQKTVKKARKNPRASSTVEKNLKKTQQKKRKPVSDTSKKKKSSQPSTKKRKAAKGNTSHKRKAKKRRKKRPIWLDLLITLSVTFVILSSVIYFGFRFPKMEGYSMNTTLNDQDRLVVMTWKKAKRFNLIYFKDPRNGQVSIRRVIGLPGEDLNYKNDELYINSKTVPERFMEQAIADAKQTGLLLTQDFTLKQVTGESLIPEGKYFVLGDNRQFAVDSREYGLIDEKDIVGVAGMRIFPFHAASYL